MATLDELQQQMSALSARVDALTTPPDDYYTSKYSGEEIDAGITKTESLPESWPLPIASGGTGADTAQLALANLGGRPNRNLIINHRMIGTGDPGSFPINQRGKKTYTPDWLQYTIDCWNVEANQQIKLEIKNGYVTVTNTDPSKELQLKQILPEGLLTAGESYTLSVYAVSVSGAVRFQIGMTDDPYTGTCIMTPESENIVSATVESLPKVSSGSWKVIYYLPAGASVTIADQKLEPGKIQTLGWKGSDGKVHLYETLDYGEELARCQRYGIPVSGGRYIGNNLGNRAIVFIPTPVTMRAKPAIQVSNYGGLLFSSGETKSPTSIEVESVESNGIKCAVNYSDAASGSLAVLSDLTAFITAEL